MKLIWRSSPYSESDIRAMFDGNAAFRDLAKSAATRLAPRGETVDADKAREFALTAAQISTQLSPQIRPDHYLHPSHILFWLKQWAPADRSGGKVANERRKFLQSDTASGEDSASARFRMAFMGSLLRWSKRWPAPALKPLQLWAEVMRQIEVEFWPYFFRTDIRPQVPTQSKAVMGFRVKRIELQVPAGAKVEKLNDKPVVVPEQLIDITLDFKSKDLVELFGDVFIGVSGNARAVWLASEKRPKVKLDALIKKSRVTDRRTPRFALPIGESVKAGDVPEKFRGL